jgi:hypothetical protein
MDTYKFTHASFTLNRKISKPKFWKIKGKSSSIEVVSFEFLNRPEKPYNSLTCTMKGRENFWYVDSTVI